MTTRETKVVHTTDHFMKVIFTVIVLCLVWLSVKDTRLEPGVTLEAQRGPYAGMTESGFSMPGVVIRSALPPTKRQTVKQLTKTGRGLLTL